jgi:hypothetical protein
MPGHLRWDKSLPLHICDLTRLLVPVALWTNHRAARAMLYFWGLGLSSQAFITWCRLAPGNPQLISRKRLESLGEQVSQFCGRTGIQHGNIPRSRGFCAC